MENSVKELMETAHESISAAITLVEQLDRDSIHYDIAINDLLVQLDGAEFAVWAAICEAENADID